MHQPSSLDAALLTLLTWTAALVLWVREFHGLAAIVLGFAVAMTLMLYFAEKDLP